MKKPVQYEEKIEKAWNQLLDLQDFPMLNICGNIIVVTCLPETPCFLAFVPFPKSP